MRKITLIFPKTSWKFEKTPYPPLGIGYLASVLLQNDWEVSIIDGQILTMEEYQKQVNNIQDQYVGISTTIKQVEETKRLVNSIKHLNPEVKIVVGGPGIVALNPDYSQNIDVIVKGEAEESIIALLEALYNDNEKTRDSKPILIECQNPVKLDDLPYPARDLFPLERYLKIWKENTGMTSTSIISSRGCPYRCIFCDKSTSGLKFRFRSAKNIVDEMEFLIHRFRFDDIFFYDDLFIFDRQRVIEICGEIAKRELEISWSAQGRVDRIDQELLQNMKNAGCKEIYFGVESGSNRILKYLRKGFNRNQIIQAFKLCHQIGIKPGMYIIVGVPGETREDLEATKNLIKESRPYLLNFSYLMPFPGTELFEKTRQWVHNYNYSEWDEMQKSVYDFPFEINPKIFHDEIYEVFQELVRKGMEVSPLQFCCDQ